MLDNSIDPKMGFLFTRVDYESKQTFWKKFNSPQLLTFNDSKENLAGEFNFTELEQSNRGFFTLELTDGGFGMVSITNYTKTINNQEVSIREINVRFLESNAIELSQPYLLYTVTNSANETNLINIILSGMLIFPL